METLLRTKQPHRGGAQADLEHLAGIGRRLAERFDPEMLRQVAGYERLGPGRRVFYEVFGRTPMARGYWNGMLKKNGAYEDRYAAPYGASARAL